MIIIELTYIKLLSEVDQFLEEHREFIKKYTKLGVFLTSGPKVPRVGGVILSNADIAGIDIDEVIRQDPFFREKIADYKITQFKPSKSITAGE